MPQWNGMPDRYTLTAEDAAARLGVTVRSVARYCEAGERAKRTKTHDPRSLVCMKNEKTDRTGEKWMIAPESVEQFIRENRSPVVSREDAPVVSPRLDMAPAPSSLVATSPDLNSPAALIRAEAAKWKAKYETEREWRMREHEERKEAEKRLSSAVFQLGTADQQIKSLEQKIRLLGSGERWAVDVDETTSFQEAASGKDVTRQDATSVETGPEESRQDATAVETTRDKASKRRTAASEEPWQ